MTAPQPPRLATALLRRLASGEQRESLIGDLIEHYQNGRSAAWYWRQAVMAILVGAVRDVRDHKLLVARALVFGWVANRLLLYAVVSFSHVGGQWIWNWTVANGFDSLRVLWFGRHGWYAPPLPAFVLVCLGYMISGWAVGRLDRTRRFAMVLVFVTSLEIWNGVEWFLYGSYLHRSAYSALLSGIFPLMVLPASVIIGGLWGSDLDGQQDHQPVE